MLADPGEHQARPGKVLGPAAEQRADLLEPAPAGGRVGDDAAELTVDRGVEDGAAEAVPVQRLDELGEQAQAAEPGRPGGCGRVCSSSPAPSRLVVTYCPPPLAARAQSPASMPAAATQPPPMSIGIHVATGLASGAPMFKARLRLPRWQAATA